ncbi:DMT family transporter [Pontibacillus litoralis]|uniref:DMT transporter permease n=1 Tax=Pontibacillus litoralis JSM 072002 TaxID=1385512 RepID=A0A0A5HLT9_9BACI|nr:DMT family transporter [Pontibacillus litoralis]KGX84582.1 DMT transporter permease [Pontibacillus litoralis JSM 072002]
MMGKNKALLAAMVFSVIIGLSFMFVKISLSYEGQLLILAQRFTFACLGLVIFLIIRPINLRLNRNEVMIVLLISLFYPIIFFSSQILGLDQTTVTEAGIIQAIAPAVTVLLASIFLKETVRKMQGTGIILSIAGVVYLQVMNGSGGYNFHLIGNLLIILSILATAVWQVMSRRATRTIKPIQITIYILLIGFIFFNAVYFISGGSFGEYTSVLAEMPYLGSILFLGVLSTFGTSLLTIYAVSKLPVIQVSVFNNVATLITILSGVLILNEPFYYYHVIGAIVIIMGVILVNSNKNTIRKAKMAQKEQS